MNPRIEKITETIAKTKRKIADAQSRLRELERQKIELENADILAAVRSIDVPPEELKAFIQKLQTNLTPTIQPEEDLPIEE